MSNVETRLGLVEYMLCCHCISHLSLIGQHLRDGRSLTPPLQAFTLPLICPLKVPLEAPLLALPLRDHAAPVMQPLKIDGVNI